MFTFRGNELKYIYSTFYERGVTFKAIGHEVGKICLYCLGIAPTKSSAPSQWITCKKYQELADVYLNSCCGMSYLPVY